MSAAHLHIQLLSTFNVRYNGAPLPALHSARVQALLALLVLHSDTPQQRPHLAFRLWPDSSEANARNNLRQLLFQLRAALPDPDRFLMVDGATLCWRSDPDQSVDVLIFRAALRAAEAAAQRADAHALRASLEQAVAHYAGALLPACYDEWVGPEREALQQLAHAAQRRLVQIQEQAHAYADALETTQAMLRLDPLDEGAYAQQIRLHALLQDPAGARRVHQLAVATFARELEAPPGEEVERAFALSQRKTRAADATGEARRTAEVPLALIGRADEWQLLRTTWAHAAAGRPTMLLITGEAGIGKSRMAEELYEWAGQQGAATARTRSYAAEGRLSLAPVAEWLRAPVLHAGLMTLAPIWQTEAARLLPELLANAPALPRPRPITEYGQRQRFFEALAHAVCAATPPLLLWIDDLQWCDVETLEWLHYLLRFDATLPLLIVGTARSEESPPDHPLAVLARQLRSEGRFISVELPPLDAAETARLATSLTPMHLCVSIGRRRATPSLWWRPCARDPCCPPPTRPPRTMHRWLFM